jgi:hypothetical protein
MKRFAMNLVMAVVLSAVMSVMAMAEVKASKVSFSRDTNVNGTVLKKGDYKVTFDDQSNELTIWQGKTAVAKATARAENRPNKPAQTTLNLTRKDNDNVLIGITFANSDKTFVIEGDNKGLPPLPTLPSLGLSALTSIE